MTLDVSQREPTTVSHTHYCLVGDVTVDDSAAIAPGVVLQALPGSRIVIGSRVCLAGGVCIQSKAGVLTISAGATLGANVLIVGRGNVGANACISPGSTLMDPQVEDNSLLAPNTLLSPASPVSSYNSQPAQNSQSTGFQPSGYPSSPAENGFASSQNGNGFRPGQQNSQNGFSPSPAVQDISTRPLPKNTFVAPGPIVAKPVQIPSIDVNAPAASYDPSNNGVQLNQPYSSNSNNGSNGHQPVANQSSSLTVPSHDRVYGRDQVSELISTLFPNRTLSNGNQGQT